MHMVSRQDLHSADLETVRTSKNPTTVVTANGEVLTREQAMVYVKELEFFVTVLLLEETPAVISLVIPTTGPAVKKHISPKMARKSFATYLTMYPSLILGLSTSSSTSSSPAYPTSSSKDTVTIMEYPATERSGSMSAEFRGNPLHEHQDAFSSSHELLMESRAKMERGSGGKHSVYTHFPKYPYCDFCLRTKITRASCRRRTGTVVPRAENFCDLQTADHKVLSEVCEFRQNHRYGVVVQDLATEWIPSYPCKTKTSQETQKLTKVLGADKETKSHLH